MIVQPGGSIFVPDTAYIKWLSQIIFILRPRADFHIVLKRMWPPHWTALT